MVSSSTTTRRLPVRGLRRGPGRWRATLTPPRRWRCGCARARSTSSSARQQLRAAGLAAAPADRGRPVDVPAAVGAARHRQDDDRRDPQPADRPAVRRGLRRGRRGQGGPRRHRRRPGRAGRAAARRPCSSSTRCTASPRPSRTRCCPGVENRWVTLVAATTENPFFSVISPAALAQPAAAARVAHRRRRAATVIDQALVRRARPRPATVELDDDAREHLVRLAGGDARRSLTYLEAAAGGGRGRRRATRIDLATAETAVDQAAVRYDRQGDQHYDVISAFIKSIRGSDADAALHYLARMIEAGEDPRFIARRLVILASEDIGLADPTALPTAVAAAQAVQLIGMPEARLNLAQATIAPRGRPQVQRRHRGHRRGAAPTYGRARSGRSRRTCATRTTPGPRSSATATGYRYSHDEPFGIAEQQYAPDVIAEPSTTGRPRWAPRRAVKERWRAHPTSHPWLGGSRDRVGRCDAGHPSAGPPCRPWSPAPCSRCDPAARSRPVAP